MSEIEADGLANDLGFGLKPRDAVMNMPILKTDKGTDCQTDVVALGNFEAELTILNASELLQTAMMGFNRPGVLSGSFALQRSHGQQRSCHLFRVAVWVNCPEHLDQAVATQVDNRSLWRNSQFSDSHRLLGARIDLPIAFQARQPR